MVLLPRGFFMSKAKIKAILPPDLRDTFRSLWEANPFTLKLRKARKTKLGDFRRDPATGKFQITLNENLEAPMFCLTFLHEYAHLLVSKKYGRRVDPHGKEWKKEFADLLDLIKDHPLFSPQQKAGIRKIQSNPPASLSSKASIYRAFLPGLKDNEQLVEAIAEGTEFHYEGRNFKVLQRIRTRSLCKETESGRKYYFPFSVRVELG